jgi:hypothetical protein
LSIIQIEIKAPMGLCFGQISGGPLQAVCKPARVVLLSILFDYKKALFIILWKGFL